MRDIQVFKSRQAIEMLQSLYYIVCQVEGVQPFKLLQVLDNLAEIANQMVSLMQDYFRRVYVSIYLGKV